MSDDPYRSDFVIYHQHNPEGGGCQVTGLAEEGIEYPTVEPAEGFVMFLGQTAIIEAVSVLFNMTPNQVKDRLTRANSQIKNLQADNRKLSDEHEKLKAVLNDVRDLAAKLELPNGEE